MRAPFLNDSQWAAKKAATLPPVWAGRITRRHARQLDAYDPQSLTGKGEARRRANTELRETVERLKTTRLPIGAEDSDIRDRAAHLASECRAAVIQFAGRVLYENGAPVGMGRVIELHGEEWSKPLAVELRAVALGDGIATPWDRRKDKRMLWGGVARMMCESWWRRQLRAQFAKAVEGAAISLGYVNKARECYASDQSVYRRLAQNKRNAAVLESVVMENESGDQFTLAELASKGVGNKAIRRGELMTRIAGFEKIARESGHDGLFLTVTCPSRMHKWATAGAGKVYENPKYDGTTPRQAQSYLVKVGARVRAALKRRGLGVYGFRIAEPNHDGTPHWHLLLFCGEVPGQVKRRALPRVAAIFRRYALADSPDEPGARLHRCKPVVIDWGRGSAAGYVAKYVAKNIDGMHVEKDLLGNDAMHTSARVEAWASTWGIKQFQQIGGAPVGVWRELRRVKELPEDAPEHLRLAWEACNKIEGEGDAGEGGGAEDGADKRKGKAADFGAYVRAQGGAFIGRDYAIRIRREDRAGEGVYGDALQPAPVGVEVDVTKHIPVGGLGCYMEKVVPVVAWSVRYVWTVVKRGLGLIAAKAATWTRVNNCTRSEGEKDAKQGGAIEANHGDRAIPRDYGEGFRVGGFNAGEFTGCGA